VGVSCAAAMAMMVWLPTADSVAAASPLKPWLTESVTVGGRRRSPSGSGSRVSAGFFPVLGVKPLAGQPVMLDGATMAFTIGVTVCCGLLFGLAPASSRSGRIRRRASVPSAAAPPHMARFGCAALSIGLVPRPSDLFLNASGRHARPLHRALVGARHASPRPGKKSRGHGTSFPKSERRYSGRTSSAASILAFFIQRLSVRAALAGSADLFADHAAQRVLQRLLRARNELAEGIVNQALIVAASSLVNLIAETSRLRRRRDGS